MTAAPVHPDLTTAFAALQDASETGDAALLAAAAARAVDAGADPAALLARARDAARVCETEMARWAAEEGRANRRLRTRCSGEERHEAAAALRDAVERWEDLDARRAGYQRIVDALA